MQGIAVSTGSACSSGSLEPSPVIRALGRDDELARGSIRFSFGKDNTDEEVDYVLEVLPRAVENLRKLSPLYQRAMAERACATEPANEGKAKGKSQKSKVRTRLAGVN
ncbi:MAG: hypothetical protein AUG51_18475 [Acidobacteria bacterium 13_1_20CM_3_53_8]|nr:MAG: hypothetical protein AUG51_18475 [Acidobacteria bacterium 13_1_20CM_3_53_8]